MARYKTKVSTMRKVKRAPSRKTIAANEKHIDFVAKLDKLAGLKPYDRRKKASSIYSKPAKKAKTPKPRRKGYSAAERRAYWVGVGYSAASDVDAFVSRDSITTVMSDKEVDSFINGRIAAIETTSKFVPDLIVGQVSRPRTPAKHKRK